MAKTIRILGVDPGLRNTGYGVIEAGTELNLLEAGVIRTESKDLIGARLERIYNGISDLMDEQEPDVLVLEKLYAHYKHPTTAILMGHARGVICLAAGLHRTEVVNLPSTRVKKAVISDGHASKDKVQRAVQGYLDLKSPPQPYDVSDALAIGIAYALMQGHMGLKNTVLMGSL